MAGSGPVLIAGTGALGSVGGTAIPAQSVALPQGKLTLFSSGTMIAQGNPRTLLAESRDPRVREFLTRGKAEAP